MDNGVLANSRELSAKNTVGVQKIATGIEGLDEILHGGLPAGRVTLINGGPGSGKSMLALEFLYQGAISGEPGFFLSFEESTENIRQNVSSFGWDLATLEKDGKLFLMHGQLDAGMILSGDFNLKGLLAIVGGKARKMGAERIVIDALDVLMRIFKDPHDQEKQIFALHKWLNEQGKTTVLTTKTFKTTEVSSPYEYLDYLADCVIHLDQRVIEQVNTKRLRVVKYRGSGYGANEYPFLVTDRGIFFSPISDVILQYDAPSQRISSGDSFLDEISGGGFLRNTSILISGETGTGKTAIAAAFARSACENGQKTLYLDYEESRDSMLAGMQSIGIDLQPAIQNGSLRILPLMPESMGIEEHLYHTITAIREFHPEHMIIDAISACERIAGEGAAFDFIMRLTHFCKKRGMTVILINQARNGSNVHGFSGIGISSMIDAIVTLRYQDVGNETKRILQLKKLRGSKHSNRYYTYLITDKGIRFDRVQSENTNPTTD